MPLPPLYDVNAQMVALAGWVRDVALGDFNRVVRVYDRVTDPGPAPWVLLELVPGAGLGGPPMAGQQWTELAVQVTITGTVVEQRDALHSVMLHALVAQGSDASYSLPMTTLAGAAVLEREGGADWVASTDDGIPQGSATYSIRLTA